MEMMLTSIAYPLISRRLAHTFQIWIITGMVRMANQVLEMTKSGALLT